MYKQVAQSDCFIGKVNSLVIIIIIIIIIDKYL